MVNNGNRTGRAGKAAALLMTAVFLLLLLPLSGSRTHAAEARPYALRFSAGSTELEKEMEIAKVVVDLYRLADVAETESGPHFVGVEPYAGIPIDPEAGSEALEKLAQRMAQIALKKDSPVSRGTALGQRLVSGDEGETIEAGLYLMIARGEGVEPYAHVSKEGAGGEKLVTSAYSNEYSYTFLPELLFLAPVANRGGEGPVELTISLKPQQSSRQGELEIVKTFASYHPYELATCVFSVEVTLKGELIYSDVLALQFSEPGRQSLLVKDLPMGSVAKVTELYSGACYEVVTESEQSVTISARNATVVEFTNEYDDTEISGSGIINYFEYDEDNGWSWQKLSGAGTTGEE